MSEDFLKYAVEGVQSLAPYQAGKPIEELQRELGLGQQGLQGQEIANALRLGLGQQGLQGRELGLQQQNINNALRFETNWGFDAGENWKYIVRLRESWELPAPDAFWTWLQEQGAF